LIWKLKNMALLAGHMQIFRQNYGQSVLYHRCGGIGKRLEKRLNRMGISNVGQLAHYPLPRLEKAFGVMGNQLYYHANGIDLSELGAPILQGQISYGKSQILLRDYHHVSDI